MKSPERMTLKELRDAEARIAKALVVARRKEREALIVEFDTIAGAHGFSVRDLFKGKRTGARA